MYIDDIEIVDFDIIYNKKKFKTQNLLISIILSMLLIFMSSLLYESSYASSKRIDNDIYGDLIEIDNLKLSKTVNKIRFSHFEKDKNTIYYSVMPKEGNNVDNIYIELLNANKELVYIEKFESSNELSTFVTNEESITLNNKVMDEIKYASIVTNEKDMIDLLVDKECNLNTINLEEDIYLIKGETKKIKIKEDNECKVLTKLSITTDNDNISIEENKIKGIKKGEGTVKINVASSTKEIKVVVTDLLVMTPNNYDKNKSLLTCKKYSKEDNDVIDKVLEYKINEVGYQTRAAAVEAARFLTLNFPYKINYFAENGRLTSKPTVDGEGRYYHKGLYLHESRFSNIDLSLKMNGPAPWGCNIYSYVHKSATSNGLDCSGFVTWVLVQGGFNPGDIGAGVTNGKQDLTDLGPKERVSTSLNNKTLKVGDLLSGDGETYNAYTGGHIAILVGIKNDHYYVAEELWAGPSRALGAVIEEYTKADFIKFFYWRIDMNSFYKEDGKLTDYWS